MGVTTVKCKMQNAKCKMKDNFLALLGNFRFKLLKTVLALTYLHFAFCLLHLISRRIKSPLAVLKDECEGDGVLARFDLVVFVVKVSAVCHYLDSKMQNAECKMQNEG